MEIRTKYKGIIFDLDGTIVDTVEDLDAALNYTLKKHGLSTKSLNETRSMIGNGMKELIRKAVPEEYKTDDELLESMRSELVSFYHENLLNNTQPYNDIPELMEMFKKKGIKLAVSSNKPDDESKLIIRTLFPNIEFSEVLGNRQGHPHKPDPEQTDEIIEKMGLDKKDILYVGDSLTDYYTAKNSGLDMILVTYGYEDPGVLENLCNIELVESTKKLTTRLAELT